MGITLRKARELKGLTIDNVSGVIGINPELLRCYETFPADILPSDALELTRLYGVSINEVNFLDV